ncbi:MAG: hypothetical protein R2708_23525 [Vicinamibacterales bacterium]
MSLERRSLRRTVAAPFQLKSCSTVVSGPEAGISYPIPVKNLNYLAVPLAFYVVHVAETNQLLFRWQRDIVEELDQAKPDWKTQNHVAVKFTACVDSALLAHVAVSVEAYYDSTAELRDGPGFVRSPTVARLVELFRPIHPFVHRSSLLSELKSAALAGTVVPIVGPPGSGKTALVAHWLTNSQTLLELESQAKPGVSVLAVDLETRLGARKFYRALTYALGVARRTAPTDSLEEADDIVDVASLLEDTLNNRLHGRRALCVFENAEAALRDSAECERLNQFLAADSLRDATTLVISQLSLPPDGAGRRYLASPVTVNALSAGELQDLLHFTLGDSAAASVLAVAFEAAPELRLPAIVKRVVNELRRQGLPGGSSDASTLVELIDAAAQPTARHILDLLNSSSVLELSGQPGRFGTLLLLACLGRQPISPARLASLSLPLPRVIDLRRIGWIEPGDDVILTPAASQVIRAEWKRRFADGLSEAEDHWLGDRLAALVDSIMTDATDRESDPLRDGLEEALAWMIRNGLASTQFAAQVGTLLAPAVADDVVFPLGDDDSDAVRQNIVAATDETLSLRLAQLTLVVRGEGTTTEFVDRLNGALNAALVTARLSAPLIRALLALLARGVKRFEVGRALEAAAYERLAPRLATPVATERTDAGYLKWAATWLLESALHNSAAPPVADRALVARDLSSSCRSPKRRRTLLDGSG